MLRMVDTPSWSGATVLDSKYPAICPNSSASGELLDAASALEVGAQGAQLSGAELAELLLLPCGDLRNGGRWGRRRHGSRSRPVVLFFYGLEPLPALAADRALPVVGQVGEPHAFLLLVVDVAANTASVLHEGRDAEVNILIGSGQIRFEIRVRIKII